jgi:perosamine synthetase
VPVIQDCAHAVGTSFAGRPVGHRPGLHAFSFQTTKNLPLVDGGMLLTDSAEDAARARRLRWMGIDRSTHERSRAGYRWHYDVTELGHRYTMSDLNAALGLAQLPGLAARQARRAAIAARYDAAFADGPIVPVTRHRDAGCSWYLYAARTPDRDALIEHLARGGIEAGVHYRRNDHYPMFRPTDLPGTAAYERTALSLPMHLGLSDDDVDRVITAVRRFSARSTTGSRRLDPEPAP